MNLTPSFVALAALMCVSLGPANASSCREPIAETTGAGGQSSKLDQIKYLLRQVANSDATQFVVIGQFQKVTDRPFVHDIEHEARMKRWRASGGQERETSAVIEYTYRKAFRFSGVRIANGEVFAFHTDSTIFTIPIDGELFLGKTPPTGKRVIGRMWEADPTYYRIDNAPCIGYQELSDDDYQRLEACSKEGDCKL